MTVLLGLPERLAGVRQLALLQVADEDDWADMVTGLAPQCGAAIATPPDGGWTDTAAQALTKTWGAAKPGRLYGIDVSDGSGAGHALAQALQPDIVIETTPTPAWPHQWALHGAWQGHDLTVETADFAVVDDDHGAQTAIDAGATRLAWRIGSMARWHRDLGRVPKRLAKSMTDAAKLLAAAWLKANPDADVIAKGWRAAPEK